MKDSERLTEKTLRNAIIGNMHAGVHKDPLVAATRKSLGRPKQKIQRRESPRQLRQVSEKTMAITKQAKKVMRSLQCCDDVINKVQMCGCLVRFSRTLCTTFHRKIFLPVVPLKKTGDSTVKVCNCVCMFFTCNYSVLIYR